MTESRMRRSSGVSAGGSGTSAAIGSLCGRRPGFAKVSPARPTSHIVSVVRCGHARNFSVDACEMPEISARRRGGELSALVDAECPEDVVDRLLWRNAQGMLARHSAEQDGS